MATCTLADPLDTASPGRADWQSVVAESVRSPGELCRLLGLSPSLAVEPTTGEVHLRHHISPNGFYKGKKVVKSKDE